jgi:hypothetical protein
MTIQELGTIFKPKFQLKLYVRTMSFRNGTSVAAIVFDKRYGYREMINLILMLLMWLVTSKLKKYQKRRLLMLSEMLHHLTISLVMAGKENNVPNDPNRSIGIDILSPNSLKLVSESC